MTDAFVAIVCDPGAPRRPVDKTTNLISQDEARTMKTILVASTPLARSFARQRSAFLRLSLSLTAVLWLAAAPAWAAATPKLKTDNSPLAKAA